MLSHNTLQLLAGADILIQPGESIDDHTLQAILAQHIEHLLVHDMQRLMQIFYRLDVEERQVMAVFNALHQQQISATEASHELASLVIKRELLRQSMRAKYSGH